MADIVDRETRSRMMRGIGSTNTAPELAVRRFLHACGLRFRLHQKGLPGRPDIVFSGLRVVVFVHGCFWHRHHGRRLATEPATNAEFWVRKFEANVERDEAMATLLENANWTSLIIWECETRNVTVLEHLYWRIRAMSFERAG